MTEFKISVPYSEEIWFFSEYHYLKIEPPPLVTLHSLDPNRLDQYKEYPRDTAIYDTTIKTSWIDFTVSFIDSPETFGIKSGMVFLSPNEYTKAQKSKPVYEVKLSECITNKSVAEHMVKSAIKNSIKQMKERWRDRL